ncbi:MAG: twin-arginine translocase TatA/TatE family subunit [Chloroflexi bacterium]|nr:twin-arginine translocase TatA/TatE family subunit [Chloroflexota bacterium]
MDFLGIGPLELFFILLIALIVLGPKDIVKAGKTLGRTMRNIVTSPTWLAVKNMTQELRVLPNKLMREAGVEDLQKELPQAQTIRKAMGIEEMEKEVARARVELPPEWTGLAPVTPESTVANPELTPGDFQESDPKENTTPN